MSKDICTELRADLSQLIPAESILPERQKADSVFEAAFPHAAKGKPSSAYSAPLSVDFDITLGCNQRCIHCNVDAGHRMPNELTTEEIKTVLTEAWEMGVWDLAITGGEAMTRHDWFELIQHACHYDGWNVQLNTNGVLWNEAIIKTVAELCPKLHVIVSLDGHNPDAYSKLRKNAVGADDLNAFDKVVKNLRLMVKYLPTPPSVNLTLTKLTIPNFFDTAELVCNDIRAPAGILGIKFFPYGRGQTYSDVLDPSYDEWKTFLLEATRRKESGEMPKIAVSVQAPWEIFLPLTEEGYSREDIARIWNYYRSPLSSKSFRATCSDIGCNAGFSYCAIAPDGEVFPCGTIVGAGYQALACGNVRDGGLRKLWGNSKTLKAIRSTRVLDIGEPCASCDLRDMCGCGCRGRAFKVSGKYTGLDIWCPKVKNYLKSNPDATYEMIAD